jgi:hypothetical protein
MTRPFLAVLSVCLLPHAVAAQDRDPDVLFLSGTAQSGTGLNGGAGEIEWLRPITPGVSVSAGGGTTSISDLWWMYGTAGMSARLSGIIYTGRISLGHGQWSGRSFPYVRHVATVTMPIAQRLYVIAGAQKVTLAGEAATVLEAGALLPVARAGSVSVAYHAAPWAPARDQSLSLRADMNVGRMSVMTGAVASARRTVAMNIQAIQLTTRIAPEYFGGCSVPLSASRLILSVEVAPQPPGRFVRFLASVKHPLGGRPSGSDVAR